MTQSYFSQFYPSEGSVGEKGSAAFASSIVINLSRDSASVPSNSDGSSPNLTGVSTTVSISESSQDVTSLWTISASPSTGVTITNTGSTYTVTGFTVDIGSITFTATRTGYATLVSVFSLSKAKAGTNGTNGINGTNGANGIVINLSNDNATVPANFDGSSPNFTGVATTLSIFEGATDVTTSWAITQSLSSGLTGTASGTPSNRTFTPTGLTVDSGTVTFTATRSGFATQTIVFRISKAKAGSNGTAATVYDVRTSQSVVKRLANGSYSNSSLLISMFSTTGSGAPTPYSGRFTVETSTDGTTYTNRYTSSTNESTYTYTVLASINFIRIRGFLAGGTSTLLDEEVIPVADDGINGTSATSISLSSSNASVPSNSDGSSPNFTGVSTTASVFEGSTDVSSLWTFSQSLSSGLTGTASNLNRTFTPTGLSGDSGTVTFTATRSGFSNQVIVFNISKAKAGTSAVLPITIRLTNPAVSIPTDTNGDNGTYTGSGTSIYVQEGQTVLDFNGSGTNGTNGNLNGGTTASTWKIESRVATGVTLGSIQADSALFATVNPISLISADTGSVVYTITGRSSTNTAFTIEVTQNFSRVKGAITDTTPPAAPSGLALTSSTSTLDGGNVVSRLLATWTANTESDLSYYEAEISEASGSYIGYTTATNRFEWVVKANVAYSVRVRAVDKNNNKSAYSTVVSQTTSRDTLAPGVPTNFVGTAAFASIFLSWTNDSASDLEGVEIWENSVNNSSTATRIGIVNGVPSAPGSFTRSGLATNVNRFYWLRSIDSSGNLSAFTASISVTTLRLISGQIADAALDAASLFSNLVRPVEVVSTLPISGNFEGRTVFLTTDGKLYRYSGSSFTRAVDGGDITANTITAGAISAGAILASKLAIGDLTNQIDNASFELGDTLWTKGSGWTIASDSATALRGTWRASRAAGASSILSDTDIIPVLDGDIWAAEAMMRTTSGATGGGFIRITGLDSSGAFVTSQNGNQIANNTTYTFSRATFTVPSGVSSIRVDVIGNNSVGILYVDEVRLLRVSGTTLIADGAITTNKIVANSINGDRITANTLNADKIVAGTITGDRFNTGTSLPGTITVGATGVSIGTVQTDASLGAQNPTTRINSGVTTIDPGKILISGSTTLANWRNGSNQTLIEGGSIAANTISANKIQIGTRGLDIAGLQFQAQLNAVSNRVDWSSGTIIYTDDAGVLQTVSIASGNATWSGSTVYIYWVKGSGTLASSTATGTAYGVDNIVLATYRGGVDLVANYGRTIIDGSQITTDTIAANQIKAGSITTSKLLVGDMSILNRNSDFEDGDINWFKEGNWTILGTDVANARRGTWVARITGTSFSALRSSVIPTQAGEAFTIDGWLKASVSGVTTAYVRISGIDVNGVERWTQDGNAISAGTTTYTRSFGTFTVPVVANAIVGVRVEVVANVSGGTVWADNVRIIRAATGELIVNGAVTADKITVTELSAIAANVGTLTAGIIRNTSDSYRVDVTNGRTIAQTGGFMKVSGAPFGSTNQFIEWYGPYFASLSSCTEANATYYLKTNGSAYFGGTLSAGILRNAAQTTDLTAAANVIVGPFSTNGGTKTITLSYEYERSFNCNQNTGSITGALSTSILLQKSLNGGASWSTLTTLNASEEQRSVFVDTEPGVQDLVIYRAVGSTTATDNTAAGTMMLRGIISTRTLPTITGTSITNSFTKQVIGVISIE